jgi:ABC-type antimicrobial peptide transport system permease subunit
VFFADSQTDVVAYGIESNYLDITRETFIEGKNFNNTNQEVVISQDVLEILGVDEDSIINQNLSLEFIPVDQETDMTVVDESLANVQGVYDDHIDYKVVGIVDNGSSPIINFPIEDAKELGIDNYSEVLVTLDGDADMVGIRREIETLGMETSSVMDTVSQIESFFRYLRIGLAVLGAIAFLIAVLGMINTLTVSLMERTREVGLLWWSYWYFNRCPFWCWSIFNSISSFYI